MKPTPPIEYQVLNLQQIAHRAGWDQGKRENLLWAIRALRLNGYPDAAEFLERQVFGETVLRVEQTNRLKPGQHQTSDQAPKVKAPDTSVEWPNQEPNRSDAGNDESG